MSDDGGQSPEPTELLPGGVGKRPEPEREADGGTLPMPAPQSRPDDETTELAPAATTSLGEGEGPGPERDAAPAPDGDKHPAAPLPPFSPWPCAFCWRQSPTKPSSGEV